MVQSSIFSLYKKICTSIVSTTQRKNIIIENIVTITWKNFLTFPLCSEIRESDRLECATSAYL